VRYTEFPDAGHNSWDATYRLDTMWDWLFAQRKH
jgi:predicted peptidase